MFDVHYLINKIISAIAGVAGVAIFSFFWLPKHIEEKSIFIKGLILGSIGTFVPLVFTSFVLRWMGLNDNDFDYIAMGAFIIGMFSPMVLHLIGNFGRKNEEKSIDDVVSNIRKGE